MVGVVVVNFNNFKETTSYIHSIEKMTIISKIAVVDNRSTDQSFEKLLLLQSDKVDVISSGKNGGYGFGNNCGIRHLYLNYQLPYVMVTNPDVLYDEETIRACVEFMEEHKKEGYAVVAPRMKNSNGELSNSAWNIPIGTQYFLSQLAILGKLFGIPYIKCSDSISDGYIECDCVAGSLLMVDTTRFLEIGLYDEDIFLYCEETTIGIKMKNKGYKTALLTGCDFVHAHSTTIKKNIKRRIKQLEIMWDSKMYVLSKYYGYGKMQINFVRLIRDICLLEYRLFGKE